MEDLPILSTTVIGSYPRPKWLRETIRLYNQGRLKEAELKEAMDDAVVATFRDHQLAGVDVPTDGEMRRDEMTEFFAERLRGFKFYGPVRVWGNNYYRKPSVVSKVEYDSPMLVDEWEYALKTSYTKDLKITITGPYTIAYWSFNEYYRSREELAFDLAKAINQEIKTLVEKGARFIQVDEPAIHSNKNEVEWAVKAVNKSIEGVNVKTIMHVCYGEYSYLTPYLDELKFDQINMALKNYNYRPLKLFSRWDREIGAGVIDVHNRRVETPQEVAKDIQKIVKYFPAERVWINPDCGLKLLPRDIAFQKMRSMVEGTRRARKRLNSYEKKPSRRALLKR